GIITPSDYIREKKGKPIQNSSWNLYKVKSIIQNEVYIGNMVLHKTEVDNRGKAKRRKPIITQNTHEAIIDKEIYYEIKNRSNKPGSKCNNINKLFSGKIKCKVCGHNFRGNRGKHTYYFCLFSRGFYDRKCYEKYISEEKMESFVLKELSVYLEKNKDKEKRYKNVSKKDTSYVNSLVKKIEKLKSDKFLLYENYMNEKCSEEKYIKTKREIDIKIESFQNIIESLKENYNEGYKELDLSKIRFNAQESSDRRNDINLIYNELKNIKKLSRDIVDMVIDIILVDSDGSIEIKWEI
ncbi:MAG: recombinase family protein, partial [Firmicutes bacterium]|nr:recombinase family protein [Bacillota bacterium]